jgi:urea transporter/murein DD-endopeptidase MepM/ murein hydrolase activator NlpD
VAALIRTPARAQALLPRLRGVAEAVLRTYAALVFPRVPRLGAVVLLATATTPRVGLGGLLGVLLSLGTARLLTVAPEAIADGSYAIGGLLLGLGVAAWYGLGAAGLILLLGFCPLCALLTAAWRSLLQPRQLPVLSLPFLVAFYLLLGTAEAAALPYARTAWPLVELVPSGLTSALASACPPLVRLLLESVGALFFLPRIESGLLLLIALTLHSRIALGLVLMALLTCLGLRALLPPLRDPHLFHSLGYNAVFTAVALGGVWFVPSVSTYLLAFLGVLLCGVLTLGTSAPLTRLGMPVLIIPFNATVLTLLMALRQRLRDGRPKVVDFQPGTPEENLAYFRTRRARFNWLLPVRLSLPVRGAWTCTQGEDGPLTHKGPWHHAIDLEVLGEDGEPHSGDPTELVSYRAYRLPVLAAADGKVVRVANDVPDNPIGGVNVQQNWGNFVLIEHAPRLYSLVAHLVPGSVRVAVGQTVRTGELLGLCGNSGRSSQPHVHFQLQAEPETGAATLPCRFADGVRIAGGPGAVSSEERVVPALLPQTGDTVRNLLLDADRAAFFTFPYGAEWTLRVQRGGADTVEHLRSDLDLYGQRLLTSREHGTSLFYALDSGCFTAYDLIGPADSVLHLLRAALGRVPLDASPTLRWEDVVPARRFRGPLLGALLDLLSPFLVQDSLTIEYRMERRGAALLVLGSSRARDRRGRPLVETRAELDRTAGPLRLAVTVRGRQVLAERAAAEVPDDKSSPSPARDAVEPAARDAA